MKPNSNTTYPDKITGILEALQCTVEELKGNKINGIVIFTAKICNDMVDLLLFDSHLTKSKLKTKLGTYDNVIALTNEPKPVIIIKCLDADWVSTLGSMGETQRVKAAISRSDICNQVSESEMMLCMDRLVSSLDTIEEDFDNRGLFSSHYLKRHYMDGLSDDMTNTAIRIKNMPEFDISGVLKTLGYDDAPSPQDGKSVIYDVNKHLALVITKQNDMSSLITEGGDVPAMQAITKLNTHKWCILTNGTEWRLYSSSVSASTSNWFAVTLVKNDLAKAKYVAGIFLASMYSGKTPEIEELLEANKRRARGIEEELASKIGGRDGILMNLVKSMVGYKPRTTYTPDVLDNAKKSSLKILYRVWFVLYAESRGLLPTSNKEWKKVSLSTLYKKLDQYSSDPNGTGCWSILSELFRSIREGNPDMDLPQYDGGLFETNAELDSKTVCNKFLVPAMRDLLEQDSELLDYSSLSVRHLGSVYEELLDMSVRQASTDILIGEKNRKTSIVKATADAAYAYKRGELYLVGRDGTLARKKGGSFYTPDKFVKFLVRRSLEPIFDAREKKIHRAVNAYKSDNSKANKKKCVDLLLDIQVLDSAMGSGHFLVEVLNQITQWAVETLNKNPAHPLWDDLKQTKSDVLGQLGGNNITVDHRLLTIEVLLKRLIMKNCIFGVDINPLAVELARLSLWLDSFAIGVPLTYIDHHVMQGDSTMGTWFSEIKNQGQTGLDQFTESRADELIKSISSNNDITIDAVRKSQRSHRQFKDETRTDRWILDGLSALKIDPTIKPKHAKDTVNWLRAIRDDQSTTEQYERITEIINRNHFFHWELEMMDAFTGKRNGFDCIVGNPPWEKNKYDPETFFSIYDPKYRDLGTKAEKEITETEILENPSIKNLNDRLLEGISDRKEFYKNYTMQGSGDKDLSQLLVEQATRLVAKDGTVSMLLPQSILINSGCLKIRESILGKKISQIYTFINSRKEGRKRVLIFPIHAEQTFMAITFQNRESEEQDEFRAAFDLTRPESLVDDSIETEKFMKLSLDKIKKTSGNSLIVAAVDKKDMELLSKFSNLPQLKDSLPAGWKLGQTRCFDATNNSDNFNRDRNGFPVLEGSNLYLFKHDVTEPELYAESTWGLELLKSVKSFNGDPCTYHNYYRAAVSEISGRSATRSSIAFLLPPNTFHTNTIYSYPLALNNRIPEPANHNMMSCYIVGIINSMVFDFLLKPKMRLHVGPLIRKITAPKSAKAIVETIGTHAARLSVGTPEMSQLAETIGISNTALSLDERIEENSKLDIEVAKAYKISKTKFLHIQDTFEFSNEDLLPEDVVMPWHDKQFRKRYWGSVRAKTKELIKTDW